MIINQSSSVIQLKRPHPSLIHNSTNACHSPSDPTAGWKMIGTMKSKTRLNMLKIRTRNLGVPANQAGWNLQWLPSLDGVQDQASLRHDP
jgi:hypothetical protein